MIRGVGTDVVEIVRVERALARFGARFVERILTPGERAHFAATRLKASHLAKRFAAKEAFAKAIGTGIRHPFGWHAVAVESDACGKPGLVPSANMGRHLASIGVTASHLSLADDAGVAMAFVVLEGGERT